MLILDNHGGSRLQSQHQKAEVAGERRVRDQCGLQYETFGIKKNIVKRSVYLPTCVRCTSGVARSAGKALHKAPGWNEGAATLLA